ncbi:MAG: ribosome biogenesis GTP-binding protein YihA/YsxC [Candidatus Cyclonatronum sp.]|uniref:ribosome biogenesis GTP-binding protein YihA/YsxC n=1 Tax=Cyclonatronum sp. TaxID=3024185 RepID=UPI0025C26558|nr:ribosome biogenesis GTP-binding protein YihA/YsxC [Cyclonatronum sp.]MCC5933274.1 YihA family ribosome biogenesis GTP-binding protein [Balneolales bacterium]MCH8485405.1 ribosome biogenesis GTP-binding protein YihA/YsxC [Cyclonatronum sp.]
MSQFSKDTPAEQTGKTPFIKQAEFVLSAPKISFCPDDKLPEFCLAGRSNVGKSSIVNALTNQNKLAKTSNVPGKTREMNYFRMNNSWYLVDLPGYGYAKVSKKEQTRWSKAMTEYLVKREELRLVLIILDIRHKPHDSDLEFMYWLADNGIPFANVFNKKDKIGKTQAQEALAALYRLHQEINIEVPVVSISAEKKDGLNELETLFADFMDESEAG